MKSPKSLKPLKPYMLRRWRIGDHEYFFTCARPGRTGDPATKFAKVKDEIVHRWILGLPKPNTVIVSLLGKKPDGTSEFSFYSFYGGFDSPKDNSGKLSFEEWIRKSHIYDPVLLLEHPTVDFEPIPQGTLEAIADDLRKLVSAQHTVVLVDSGGVQRTGTICKHIGATEDTTS